MNKTLVAALAVAVLGLPLQVQAYPITILNAGFESPATTTIANGAPTFWTEIAGGGGSGAWNINAFPASFWTVPAPEGNQIAWLSDAPHPGSPTTLFQVLSSNLAPTTYHLSGEVGHPIGFDTRDGTPTGAATLYTASLYAGGNFLASTPAATGPSGTFATFDLFFDARGSAFLGQALEVRLESNQAQTGFDAISLTAPDGGLTALLLGMSMMGLGWMRRRMN